ncbi:MAG: hypothetical protein JNL01_15960 [Bdellovibrionales bacterium]|nr:hypothetical protein [Bdellovibrionales bacterium]
MLGRTKWGFLGIRGAVIGTALLTATGCELTSTDRQIVTDAFDPSVTSAPPATPIPVTQIPACHVERFTQPPAVVTEKLDLLLVVDTSGSLNAERGKLADAMDAFIRALPSTLDYRIAVMPAHGPHSQWAGKIFRRNKNEAWILDSESMSLATIQAELKDRLTKQSEIPNDSKSDGGEMGIYSLMRALDADRVALARSQGFFRTDAALVSVFMSDENDICAVYPSGVTPVPDPQGAEKKALAKDCSGVTKEALSAKLASFMGDRPYVTAAVIYNNLSTVPRGKSAGENELGYGYLEFVQATNGITIDMADANYRTGMETLGNRVAVRMNLKSDFTLARAGLSAASVVVTLDGAEVPYTMTDPGAGGMASVKLASPGLPSSTIDVTYCTAGADTVPPVLDVKPANGGMISRGVRPVLGTANEALSSISVSVGSLSPVALTLSNDRLSFSGSLDFGAPGVKTLVWTAVDMAGNRRKLTTQVDVSPDVTAPVIAGGPDSPILTNQVLFTAPITVTDESSVNTKVFLNGVAVQETSAMSFTLSTTLAEGMNAIKIESTDAVGLTSSRDLAMVTLDTVAPVVAISQPIEGQSFSNSLISVSGLSAEALSFARVQNTQLTLGSDSKSFVGQINLGTEGQKILDFEFFDLAGNRSAISRSVTVSLKVLNENLISVHPDPDGIHLLIRGATGAARAGAQLAAAAGFFNRASGVASQDGSFELKLSAFTSADVTATDLSSGQSLTTTVNYGIGPNTRLSGVVRNTRDEPLLGVTVRIVGTQLQAMTDAQGVFQFTQTITGDQTLWVDGATTVPSQNQTGPEKYGQSKIAITIGLNRSNVIGRPIYLTPIPQDGSAVLVDTTGGTVASPHAQGSKLEIPAGAIQLPAGSPPVAISMAEISGTRTLIPPPAYAVPMDALSLEPSGLKFSKRVRLTVPNYNELPAGVKLFVISMNSTTGLWEMDGLATVSDDGTSVVTDEGLGISHFSTVYMAPMGPKVTKFADQDRPGANSFDGALVRRITMPSYQVMGSAVAPSLTYKSSWAKPTTLITNLFDIPKQEIFVSQSGEGSILGIDSREVTATVRAWYEPERITAQFQTQGIASDSNPSEPGAQPMVFTGIPNKAAISYAVDMSSFPSGVYPYNSHYEVQLKRMVVATRKTRYWGWFERSYYREDAPTFESQLLNQVFPQDQNGNIYVQNHTQGPAGQGWRIDGPQRIINPDQNLLLLEEGSGEVTGYAISDTISTVWKNQETESRVVNMDFAFDLKNFPQFIAGGSDGKLYSGTLDHSYIDSQPALTAVSSPSSLTGRIRGTHFMTKFRQFPSQPNFLTNLNPYQASNSWTDYSFRVGPRGILKLPDGRILYADQFRDRITLATGSGTDLVVVGKQYSPPPTYNAGVEIPKAVDDGIRPQIDALCALYGEGGMGCHSPGYSGDINCPVSNGSFPRIEDFTAPGSAVCNFGPSTGTLPVHDFSPDGAIATGLSMNQPMSLAPGPRADSFVIAEKGSHRVRLLDLTTGMLTTVAGNGQTDDTGSDIQATSASIRHPQAAVYDALGNLYISSQGGSIRKVNPNGVITWLVGAPGSTIGDNILGTKVLLQEPTGLIFDNSKGILYIAETGGNKIRKVDISTGIVSTVAGNGVPTFAGDNGPALFASLSRPTQVELDSNGNLLVVDSGNQRIRKITIQNSSGNLLTFKPQAQDLSTLAKNSDGTWTRTFRSGTVVSFDSSGRQISTKDRIGLQSFFEYDSDGKLTKAIDVKGKETTYGYMAGRLDSVTDPAGRVTRFGYVGNRLSQTIFPEARTRTYDYFDSGLLKSETNERSKTTTFEYNEWNRIAKVTNAYGKSVVINDMGSATASNHYDGEGKTGTLKNVRSNEIANIIKDAKGIETKLKADDSGYISLIEGTNGLVTKIERDARGRLTAVYRNYRDSGTPDLLGDDRWDSKLENVYDPVTGDLLSERDSLTGIRRTKTYNSYGQIVTELSPTLLLTTHTYDPVTGLETETSDQLSGVLARYTYNPLGQILSVENALGHTTTYTYDSSAGNLKTKTVSIDSARSSVVEYVSRDSAGNPTNIKDPNGESVNYVYNLWNELTKVTSAEDEVTQYAYSDTGKLTKVTDHLLNTIEYTLDDLDRVVEKKDQKGKTTTYGYDDNGNMELEVDPNGNQKRFVYDLQNRVIEKILPDDHYTFEYHPEGALKQAENRQFKITVTLDEQFGRVTSSVLNSKAGVSYPQVVTGYGYDSIGRLDQIGQSRVILDPYGRVKSQSDLFGQGHEFTYDKVGRLETHTRQGSVSSFEYDRSSFLTKISHDEISGPVPSVEHTYGRDLLGSRTNVGRSGMYDLTLGYDKNQQLKTLLPSSSDSIVVPTETFSYDKISNRKSDQGGQYNYDSESQRLTSDYRFYYFYDANGNLTSKQPIGLSGEITNFGYTSENQLKWVKVYRPAGTHSLPFEVGSSVPVREIYYSYDPIGRRVIKQVVDNDSPQLSFTRKYGYNDQNVVAEYDENNQFLAFYTHRIVPGNEVVDDVLAVKITEQGRIKGLAQSAGDYYFLKDGQGSVTEVYGETGLVQRIVYGSFGKILSVRDAASLEVTSAPPLKTHFAFTGREFDEETGNYYYRARYYDPNTGRFLQKDPEPGKTEMPSTVVNSSIFVLNNPLNLADPTGRFPWLLAIGYMLVSSHILATVSTLVHVILNDNPDTMFYAKVFAFNALVGFGMLGFGALAYSPTGVEFSGVSAQLTGISDFGGLSIGPVNLVGGSSNGVAYSASEIAKLMKHEASHSIQWAAIPWVNTRLAGMEIPLPLGYSPIAGVSLLGAAGFPLPGLYSFVENEYFGFGGPFSK